MNTLYCSPSCNGKDYKNNIRQRRIAELMEEKVKTPERDLLGRKEFLTPTEGSLLLGISRATFYRYMRDGTIKAVQLKGKTIVRRKDIDKLFDNPPSYHTHIEKKQEKREYYTIWKSRAHLTPEGKAVLTPENLFVLTPVKS
jgi:excisionase family DNA binding protein